MVNKRRKISKEIGKGKLLCAKTMVENENQKLVPA